jgi:hypothetical protein
MTDRIDIHAAALPPENAGAQLLAAGTLAEKTPVPTTTVNGPARCTLPAVSTE